MGKSHQNFPRHLPFLKFSRNHCVPTAVTDFPGRSSHRTSSPSLPALLLSQCPRRTKRRVRGGQTEISGSHQGCLQDLVAGTWGSCY